MIIITGDSWGVGGWSQSRHSKNEMRLTSINFATLVSLHNDLGSVNLCGGGSTLSQALYRYEKFLNRYTPNYTDIFYWIITNPLRNIDINTVKTWTTIEQAANNILIDNLQKADRLAGNYKIQINLIGGLCDLDPNLVNGLNNLVCAVPSWCSLINKEHVESIFNDDGNWQEIGNYIKEHRLDLIDEWISLSDFILSKNNFYKKNSTYFNYGDNHPNLEANQLLKNYLYPKYTHIC
jgi:hypothetical protein